MTHHSFIYITLQDFLILKKKQIMALAIWYKSFGVDLFCLYLEETIVHVPTHDKFIVIKIPPKSDFLVA